MTDWATFPARNVSSHRTLYRIHRSINHPAWFNDDGGWRFDPPLSHRGQYGVCYLGIEALSCYVEVFGRTGTIPRAEIDLRALSEVSTTRNLTLADVTDREALGFRVNAALSASPDYSHSQQLSGVLFDAGFDGIYYRVRHDPTLTLEAVALFGPVGEQPTELDTASTEAIPDDLIRDGYEQFGLAVVPIAPLP